MTISGVANSWTLPNYVGPLFNLTPKDTVTLQLMGGVGNARGIRSTQFGFQTETVPAAAQPAILEGADPNATEEARTPVTNAVQIFQYGVKLTYSKQAAVANTGSVFLGDQPVQNENQHQIDLKLMQAARDMNYTALNGTYQLPTDNASARKTRGILTAISTNVIAAGGAPMSKKLWNQLLKAMADSGAHFRRPVVLVSSFQKQKLSEIFAFVPMDRNLGGENIVRIDTDFGSIEVAFERMMPADTMAVVEFDVVAPVFLLIPDEEKAGADKGVVFVEPLAKTGSATNYQVYAEFGVDHGPEIMHGKITGLATA